MLMTIAKPFGIIAGSVCQILLPVISGVLVAVSFPPFDLWWLAWVALVPLALSVALSNRILEPLIGAFIGCVVLHLIGLDWIRTSFQGTGLSGPCAMAWLATAFFASPAWIVVVTVIHHLFHRLAFPMSVALSAGWMAGDLTRRLTGLLLTETDFPWLQLAATQTHFPHFIQVADIIGAAGVGALLAFANGTLCDVLRAEGRQKVRALVCATIVLPFVFAYGAWRLSQPDLRTGPTVCLMPWNSLPSTISDPSSLRGIADILLWPEGAIQDDGANDAGQTVEIERFAKATGAFVAVGWRRIRPGFTANSMALVDPAKGLVDIYDKSYLVPWTELSPRVKIPYITSSGNANRAGTDHRTVFCAETCIAPAICYDACFPAMLRRFDSPDLYLVASSETADQTKRMPQHVAQVVQLCAIQLRRSIVRSVRGGHSGLVDGCGRVRSDVFDIQNPVVVGPVPIDERFSLYAEFGDTVLLIPVVALVACAFWHRRRQRNNQE